MSGYGPEQRVAAYLDEVSGALADVPAEDRSDIVNDLEAHITDALGGNVQFARDVDVLNVLDRLGHPQEVAREARQSRGHEIADRRLDSQPATNPYAEQQRHTPGALEIAAIVLTALMWPIGVILAWVSDRWTTRSKIIATIISLTSAFILGAIVVAGMIPWESGGSSSTVVDVPADSAGPAGQTVPQDPAQTEPRSPADVSESGSDSGIAIRMFVVLGFLFGAITAPFVAAVFLAVRMLPTSKAGGTRMNSDQIHGAASTMPGTRAW